MASGQVSGTPRRRAASSSRDVKCVAVPDTMVTVAQLMRSLEALTIVAVTFGFILISTAQDTSATSLPGELPTFRTASEVWRAVRGQADLDQGVRRRRGAVRDRACEMLIAFDETMFRHFDRDLQRLVGLGEEYVKRLNGIYHRTLLAGSRIYFRIKEVRVLFDFCEYCNLTQEIYLGEFTKMNTADFCLAHLFTYRDFPNGIQGLAWTGTLCRKKYNTGFTTLLNHQVQSTVEESAMTFSHEVGHNFGAKHDEDVSCPPGFLMSAMGTKDSEPRFSECSLRDMTAELSTVLSTPHLNCFVDKLETVGDGFAVCGNGIVESPEECDCGLDAETCSDPCCYPGHVDAGDLRSNHSAIPCRTHRQPICQDRFHYFVKFGLLGPLIFLAALLPILALILCYDWRNGKRAFGHLQGSSVTRSGSSPRRRWPQRRPRPTSPTDANFPSRTLFKKPIIIRLPFFGTSAASAGATEVGRGESAPRRPLIQHWNEQGPEGGKEVKRELCTSDDDPLLKPSKGSSSTNLPLRPSKGPSSPTGARADPVQDSRAAWHKLDHHVMKVRDKANVEADRSKTSTTRPKTAFNEVKPQRQLRPTGGTTLGNGLQKPSSLDKGGSHGDASEEELDLVPRRRAPAPPLVHNATKKGLASGVTLANGVTSSANRAAKVSPRPPAPPPKPPAHPLSGLNSIDSTFAKKESSFAGKPVSASNPTSTSSSSSVRRIVKQLESEKRTFKS